MEIGIRSCLPRGVLIILVCLFLTACGRADKAYEKAFAENSIQAYQTALKEYPDHERAGEARARLEAMLSAKCTTDRDRAACDTYLTTFPKESRTAEIGAIRDEVAIEAALAEPNRADEFGAYEKLIQEFPNQKALVKFDGSFTEFLEQFIPPGQICSGDRPELTRLASEQGYTLEQIDGFPGLRVVIPNGSNSGMAHGIPNNLCPLPIWEADRIGVLDPPVERPDGSVVRSLDFGELSKKVFTFIAKEDEAKYRIVAARAVATDPKPGE
jgi:hypothetical protein